MVTFATVEKVPVVSCKEIVTDNASAVFHVFYASFTSLEQTIHDRGTHTHTHTHTHTAVQRKFILIMVSTHFYESVIFGFHNQRLCSISTVQKGRSINDQVKELLDVVLPSLEVSHTYYLLFTRNLNMCL